MAVIQVTQVPSTGTTKLNFDKSITEFDIYNNTNFYVGISFGIDTGIGEAEYFVSPYGGYLRNVGPFAAMKRKRTLSIWNGIVFLYTQNPAGGTAPAAPSTEVTIIGNTTGFNELHGVSPNTGVAGSVSPYFNAIYLKSSACSLVANQFVLTITPNDAAPGDSTFSADCSGDLVLGGVLAGVGSLLITNGQNAGASTNNSLLFSNGRLQIWRTGDGIFSPFLDLNAGALSITVGQNGQLIIGPSATINPLDGGGNDVRLSQAGKTTLVRGQLDVMQNCVLESELFIHNNNGLNLVTGSIHRMQVLSAALTTVSQDISHSLGVTPDIVLGTNQGTNNTAISFKWDKNNSNSSTIRLISSANGTFYLLLIKT